MAVFHLLECCGCAATGCTPAALQHTCESPAALRPYVVELWIVQPVAAQPIALQHREPPEVAMGPE